MTLPKSISATIKDKYIYSIELWRSSMPLKMLRDSRSLELGRSIDGDGMLMINGIPYAYGEIKDNMFCVKHLVPEEKIWEVLDRDDYHEILISGDDEYNPVCSGYAKNHEGKWAPVIELNNSEDFFIDGKNGKPFDFTMPNYFKQDEMNRIKEFALGAEKRISSFFTSFLLAKTSVNVDSIRNLKYEDYMIGMGDENIFSKFSMEPYKGCFNITMDRLTAGFILDLLCGSPVEMEPAPCKLSEYDRTLMEGISVRLVGQLWKTWSKALDIFPRLKQVSDRDHDIHIMDMEDLCVDLNFQVQIGSHQGNISVCMPFSLIRAIFRNKDNENDNAQHTYAKNENAALLAANIPGGIISIDKIHQIIEGKQLHVAGLSKSDKQVFLISPESSTTIAKANSSNKISFDLKSVMCNLERLKISIDEMDMNFKRLILVEQKSLPQKSIKAHPVNKNLLDVKKIVQKKPQTKEELLLNRMYDNYRKGARYFIFKILGTVFKQFSIIDAENTLLHIAGKNKLREVMENIFVNWIEKGKIHEASVLVIVIGAEIATLLIRSLRYDLLDKLVDGIARLQVPKFREKQKVLFEFYRQINRTFKLTKEGLDILNCLVEKSVNCDVSTKIIGKVDDYFHSIKEGTFLKGMSDYIIYKELGDKRPQYLAMIFTILRPYVSANVISRLDDDVRIEVINRIRNFIKVDYAVFREIERVLERKCSTISHDVDLIDGDEAVEEILRYADEKSDVDLGMLKMV